MKKILPAILLSVFLIVPGVTVSAVAANLKIGFFDLQRVIGQSQAGKDARAKYLERTKQYQDEIQQRTNDLDKLRTEIKAEAKKLKKGESAPPALVAKNEKAAREFRLLQRRLASDQDELKRYDADLTRGVVEKLQPVLGKFSEENKYDFVFKLGGDLVYGRHQRDITDALIQAFDKAYKANSGDKK